jgi:hypothetical protein
LEGAVPNTYDASQVMEVVLNRYEGYLPGGLASKVRGLNPARVFRILPESEYRQYFGAVFRNFFAAINVCALGGTKRMIGIANDGVNDPFSSIACPAFCAPAVEVTDRVIYVNRDLGVTVGTLYHEFIHYLSHPNFYPEFYSLGGRNPEILEGVTEYLTRRIRQDVAHDRYSQGKYQTWFKRTSHDMGGDPTATLDELAALAFRGDFSCMPKLGGAIPRL